MLCGAEDNVNLRTLLNGLGSQANLTSCGTISVRQQRRSMREPPPKPPTSCKTTCCS